MYVQVSSAGDIRALPSPADDVEVTWRVGHGVADDVRAAAVLPGRAYAWVAGEAALVRDLRRYLTRDLSWSAGDHYFGDYWKRGVTGT